MPRRGQQIFIDELERFAIEAADLSVSAIAKRVAAPLQVSVRGRHGVGCSTVAHALARAGIEVASPRDLACSEAYLEAGVEAYVVAEVIKPEDFDAIAALRHPVMVVLNKADLTDRSIAAARRRCANLSALTGLPTEPMVGLLAVAALDGLVDDGLWAALRVLATEPGDLSSTDGFVAGPHSVPRAVRLQLLDTLDLFGIAHAVNWIRQRRPAEQFGALLRRVSGVDSVIARAFVVGAEVRYRRTLAAVVELETLAVTDSRIGDFLSREGTVLARMADAVDMVESAGLELDPRDTRSDDPMTYVRRVARWRRYASGPVSAVHRACGADIAAGSMRLWRPAGGTGESACLG